MATVSTLFLIAVIAVLAPLLSEITPVRMLPVVVAEIVLGIAAGPLLDIAEPDALLTLLAGLGLAFLFFLAGAEIDINRISGRPLLLGASGWACSLVLAVIVAAGLAAADIASPVKFVAAALATTALGTLMPILRDAHVLETHLGRYVIAVGMFGELCPIILISLLLSGSTDEALTTALLIAFTIIALACAVAAKRLRPPRFMALLDRSMHTTSQLPVRVCVLLLVALVYVARDFGFDVILGAFAAGMVVSLASPSIKEPEVLKHKLEAIGFGFLVPVFFITSGITFDLDGLTSDPGAVALVPIFLLALLAVRGLPALLYSRDLGRREQLALAFYSATTLPIVVAITTIAVTDRKMDSDTAAALVAAGMLSVLIFPTVARLLTRAATASARAAGEAQVSEASAAS
jgi:Kef-type K+ transport system membrane component KefB